MARRSHGGHEILIEIVTIGAYATVSAIDSKAGTEGSIYRTCRY